MTPTPDDIANALLDLEVIRRKIFEDYAPLTDEHDRDMRRAIAILRALAQERAKLSAARR